MQNDRVQHHAKLHQYVAYTAVPLVSNAHDERGISVLNNVRVSRGVCRASQSDSSGHSLHEGFRRVQSVAPMSIMAWLYSATRFFGVNVSAISHRWLCTFVFPGQPSTA